MPASTYLGNKVLDLVLRGVAFTAPTRVYVSLHTADPGVTGANEVDTVNWPAYVRQDPAAAAAIATGFGAASSKTTENAKELLFPAHDGATNVDVTHLAIWDAESNGNCLLITPLSTTKIIQPTDEVVIKIGDLSASII